jgi:hypothetical protein
VYDDLVSPEGLIVEVLPTRYLPIVSYRVAVWRGHQQLRVEEFSLE